MFTNRCRILLISLSFTASFMSLEAKRMVRNPNAMIKKCPEKCALAFRCSPYYSEELIWTIVDGMCKVFANGCVRASEDCHRQNDCKSPIIDSNKEECQQRCAVCSESLPESKVCGWFPKTSPTGERGEEMREFRNQCDLDKWSCMNGQPYGSVSPGTCA